MITEILTIIPNGKENRPATVFITPQKRGKKKRRKGTGLSSKKIKGIATSDAGESAAREEQEKKGEPGRKIISLHVGAPKLKRTYRQNR